MPVSRRVLFKAGLGAGFAVPTLSAMSAAPSAGFAPVDRLDDLSALEIFTRMRCSPEGAITTWWYSGHMLARAGENPAQPILSVIGASQSSIIARTDGSIGYSLIEAGYYGDPDTGDIADGPLANRLTGVPMTPEHYLSPQSQIFEPNGSIRPDLANLPPQLDYKGRWIGPDIKAGRVWMAEELFVKMTGAQPKVLNSLANFEANEEDICNGGAFVPATFEYTTWNSFRPWMNMGTASGAIMMRLNSVKLKSWQGLPAALRNRIEADHPGRFSYA
jgi:hypothetical protein